jgi:hypothetical protein
MFLVAVAALGVDSIVVAAVVGALMFEHTLRAGRDAAFDATLGLAILFVTVAWLAALIVRGWHSRDNRLHPPDLFT